MPRTIKNYVPNVNYTLSCLCIQITWNSYQIDTSLAHPIPIYEVHNTIIITWRIGSNSRLIFKFPLKEMSRFELFYVGAI